MSIRLSPSGFGFDSGQTQRLIKEQGVTLSPGNNFGSEWDSYVRISYACSLDNIKEAMDKIKLFVDKRIEK